MKIVISENVYEEYRQSLKEKASSIKEERQKMLSLSYIFSPYSDEVSYGVCFLSSFLLYVLILVFFLATGESNKEVVLDLLPAFLISFLFVLLLQAYSSFNSTSKVIKSWNQVLEACDNLSPEDFIKYMKNLIKSYMQSP